MEDRSAFDGPRGGYSLYVVAIIAALLMTASFAWQQAPASEDEGRWAVQAGDVLQYDVAGHRNGTAVSGTATANFTVVNVTEYGRSVGGYFTTDLGSWTGRGMTSVLSSPDSGECLGWERIETVYGAKAVTRYISYHGGSEDARAFIVTYAGVDSKVIYRVNVSGPGFFLNLDLRTSTLDDPADLDIRKTVDISHSFMVPSVMNFTSVSAAGTSSVGYWHLPDGAHLNHSMESDGSQFYLVTEENIERMEHGGVMESDSAMSLLNGGGSHSALLDSGLYIVVTDAGAAVGDTWERFEILMPS